jgi:NADH-quinone oxidoreductase subunit F
MRALCSVEELRSLREEIRGRVDRSMPRLVVCGETACQASGSGAVIEAAKEHIVRGGLLGGLGLKVTGCHGFCEVAPSVLVEPQGAFYVQITPTDIPRIAGAAVAHDYVEELLYRDPHTGEPYYDAGEIPFFRNQRRTVLGRGHGVDPTRIGDYIGEGGYDSLARVLAQGDRQWALDQVKRSGLRGRGGAGFPTGRKWELLARQDGAGDKFLICNADEGDPGAYMDRSLLEGHPHAIIEGMLIGAYATGATRGVVYVRKEYPLAIRRLEVALRQAREAGLLGRDILGSGLDFDIDVVRGAGAFVCGEETALIRSLEGRSGEPRQRPPFPIERGVEGRPTAINNVETWANVRVVIAMGAEEFARTGTPGSPGTKIFSLVGKIRNTGLVEVPMGTTLKQIVYDIGGGARGKSRVKAVQTGGPSGGCIPASMFDLPVDYDSLAGAGSIMGSGGMIVMDDDTCMVDVAKYFMGFLKEESCGKCFTCRKGTQRMYEILDDVSKGVATPEQLEALQELAEVVKDTTMCGLGQTASNPVLSTLRYFREEYEEHVERGRCRAFVCSDLVGAPCQSACPLDTEAWRYAALIEKGLYEEAYRVIREANPFPSVCARVCGRRCERRCSLGVSGGEAVALRALKRFVTDRVDPSAYVPAAAPVRRDGMPRVAVVGAGPAGLSAAHYLSGAGHRVTVFEAGGEPGGMLVSCIPMYRLPVEVVRAEVGLLLGEDVTVRCGAALGRDFTIDGLVGDGFGAVFLAMGADRSRRLGLEGEDLEGVYPSIDFLKAQNLRGEELARGRVGVVGGGNSAVDAARVALRQAGTTSVTLLYRRTAEEMPAYAEEVEAALEEGIKLETLVSPVAIRYVEAAEAEGVRVETFVTPVRIDGAGGRLAGIECIRNRLGDVDASGRRRPVPVAGTEFHLDLDTLVVAIGESPASECLASMGVELDEAGRPRVDHDTLETSRPGVFAGGDLITGPNTVVDAIAAGRTAAESIRMYLAGTPHPGARRPALPTVYVEPADVTEEEADSATREEPPTLSAEERRKSFAEVELGFSVEQAVREARRCLRCDLAFTRPGEAKGASG